MQTKLFENTVRIVSNIDTGREKAKGVRNAFVLSDRCCPDIVARES